MFSRGIYLTSLVALLCAGFARAANTTTISTDGCVRPDTFATCLQSAQDATNLCVQQSFGNGDATIACGIGLYENQLDCFISDCWNKVLPIYGFTLGAV